MKKCPKIERKSASNYKNSAKKLNEKGILKVTPSWLESIVVVHGLKGEKGVCERNAEQGAVRAGRSLIHS
jgi:hypothetical protein